MNQATENLLEAQKYALKIRPKVGGFPYLAETLRLAGITHNFWFLPSCQAIYLSKQGPVVTQGAPLINGMLEIPKFSQDALIKALRRDQAGEGTFPEFLKSAWTAGVVRYAVDFEKRQVTYYGVFDEAYTENYPVVKVNREI